MQERIVQLCGQCKLPAVAAETVAHFTAAGHGDALATFLEVLEQEAEDSRHRRINRLRRESRLPTGKTWETPVFTGAGSSSMTGCPWPCGAHGLGERWTATLDPLDSRAKDAKDKGPSLTVRRLPASPQPPPRASRRSFRGRDGR